VCLVLGNRPEPSAHQDSRCSTAHRTKIIDRRLIKGDTYAVFLKTQAAKYALDPQFRFTKIQDLIRLRSIHDPWGEMSDLESRNFVRARGNLGALPDYRIKWLARFVYSDAFEMFIAIVIASNAAALAILTFPGLAPETISFALRVDGIAFIIYCVELTIRIVSYGKKPWMFFRQGWNVFDFIVIAASPLFAGQTVILRLLRLFRLVRIFRFLPEVRILSSSIAKSLPPLLSMSALIGLLLFLYGMVGNYLFGIQLNNDWGTIGSSMMSLVVLLTTENFPVYLSDGLAVSPLAVPYFLSYLFIIVFTVLNLLIGIVLNAMDEARAEARKNDEEIREFALLAKDLGQITEDGIAAPEDLRKLKAELERLKELARKK
jgi:voltage-gated sodium channel